MKEKGFAPLIIILGVAVLVITGFLISRLIKPGAEQVSNSVPATPTPTVSLGFKTTPTTAPTKIAKQTITPTQTPTPTVAAVSPYQIEAELICARADDGYADGKHVDLKWQVTVSGEASIPFGTLTLTDNKTKAVFDFGNVTPSGNDPITTWGGLGHWKVQDRDGNEMPFVADGRDYTLKLYKLTTRSQAVTQDLQPVAQKTFSKICEF
ncbi:MAG: hypothetical protein V1808_02360 [Candidatus Daviesbacteria bacterium]